MTNEEKEKAREIAYKHKQQCYYAIHGDLDNSFEECYQSAIEAMQWKDEQSAKEKQKLIDEACNLMQHWILEHDYVDIIELEDYIKQKMEEL